MGEVPNTNMRSAKTLAFSFTGNKSLTSVIAVTEAAQLPNA
jgi:hypothetical protein